MKKIADVIIPHHNRHDHLKNLLDCISPNDFNIIIISGGSFAENCNKGARLAETDNLIFLNDDVIVSNNSLINLSRTKDDFVSMTEFIPQEGVHYFGVGYDKGKRKFYKSTKKDQMLFPCGYLFKMKKSVWEQLGGFDEGFINGGEDGDLGLRALSQGVSIGWLDEVATHFHSQSDGRLLKAAQNQILLDKKWPQFEIDKLFSSKPDFTKSLDSPGESPLKILVANNHLDRLGGSETFTYATVKELVRKGFDVDVFSLQNGMMSKKISEFANIVEIPRKEYDLLLINHNSCLEALKQVKGFKIYTSHGIFPSLEKARMGADAYVAISEEVAASMSGFNPIIIRNGIDCERFKPTNPVNMPIKKVLSMCQGEEAKNMVKEACGILGLEFEFVERNVFEVEEKINQADLVVSLGRGVMEAMACGRSVFVFDSRKYMKETKGDGIITDSNWKMLAEHNFSGRKRNIKYTVQDIVKNIQNCNINYKPVNRQIALENFNIAHQVDKYLSIFTENKK